MKKIFLLGLLFIFAIHSVFAVDIGIIVELEDGTVKTDCVRVSDGTDGKTILDKTVFDTLWSPSSPFGQLICKIEEEGTEIQGNFCEFSGSFWNFNILPNGDNQWIHSPVGHNGPGGCWNRQITSFGGHYCGMDKDVIGYAFGSGGDEPPLKTFKQVCERLVIKDIKVFVDGKKEIGADEDGGSIDVLPGSDLKIEIEIENSYTRDDDVKIKEVFISGIIEDINNGKDLLSEANDFNLEADRRKRLILEFSIPKITKKDNYDLTIEIDGKNERGFEYFYEIEFGIDITEKVDIDNFVVNIEDETALTSSAKDLDPVVGGLNTQTEPAIFMLQYPKVGEEPILKGSDILSNNYFVFALVFSQIAFIIFFLFLAVVLYIHFS